MTFLGFIVHGETSTKSFFSGILFSLILMILVSLSYDYQVFAQRNVLVEKTLDIEKEKLQKTMIDLQNYEKIFPQYVSSAETIELTENKTIANLELRTGFIPVSVQAEIFNHTENQNEIRIISGDFQGSTITTTLEKTWSYNGVPDMGTTVVIDLSLEVSGFLALLGLISDDIVMFSIDKSLLEFVDYSKGDFQKNQNEEKSNHRSR